MAHRKTNKWIAQAQAAQHNLAAANHVPRVRVNVNSYNQAVESVLRVNWCLANCTGRFIMQEPHIVEVEKDNFGGYIQETLSPPSFIFELTDDAMLFKMMFEGSM